MPRQRRSQKKWDFVVSCFLATPITIHAKALLLRKPSVYVIKIYNVAETLVTEFDKQFPPKEILHGTPMQKKFEQMVKRVKPY